jgi:hypothetical protein
LSFEIYSLNFLQLHPFAINFPRSPTQGKTAFSFFLLHLHPLTLNTANSDEVSWIFLLFAD